MKKTISCNENSIRIMAKPIGKRFLSLFIAVIMMVSTLMFAAVSSSAATQRSDSYYDESPAESAANDGSNNETSEEKWKWPLTKQIFVRGFDDNHKAIDISAPTGTAVYAAKSGTVYCSSDISADASYTCPGCGYMGAGYHVVLRHSDGYDSFYDHLSKVEVAKGTYVNAGQKVGEVGSTGNSTGPHLHFAITSNKIPVDPLTYITPFSSVRAEVSDNDVKIIGDFGGYGPTIQTAGFYIGTSANNMEKYSETLDTNGYINGVAIQCILYNMSKDYPYLVKGNTYYFKMYITRFGKEYCSDIYSFTYGDHTQIFSSVRAEVTDNDVIITGDLAVYGPDLYGKQMTGGGFYIGTSKDNMTKFREDLNGYAGGEVIRSIFYKMSKWYPQLAKGNVYYYKMFLEYGGDEYCSDIYSFTYGDLIPVFSSVRAEVTDNDVKITGDLAVYGPDRYGKTMTGGGFYIGTSKDNMTKLREDLNGYAGGEGIRSIFYKMSKWYPQLAKGNVYYYKMFLEYGGDEYCSDIYSFTYGDHIHSWNSGSVTKAPTCTEEGTKTYTCTSCSETKTEAIAATGHTAVTVAGKPATCVNTGLTDGSKCSVCGTVIKAQTVIPTTAHSYTHTVIAPTVSTQGYTLHTCTVCGNNYKDTYTDPLPTPTDPEVIVTVEAPSRVTLGKEFTLNVYLEGTYDGYYFEIPKYNGFTYISSAAASNGIKVDEKTDRLAVSVMPGLEATDTPKTLIATVTYSVNKNTALGERTLSIENAKITNESGDVITAVLINGKTVEVAKRIAGDINGDDVFDYTDVAKLYAYFREKTTIDSDIDIDFNKDGSFDYTDVAKLYAIFRGKSEF